MSWADRRVPFLSFAGNERRSLTVFGVIVRGRVEQNPVARLGNLRSATFILGSTAEGHGGFRYFSRIAAQQRRSVMVAGEVLEFAVQQRAEPDKPRSGSRPMGRFLGARLAG